MICVDLQGNGGKSSHQEVNHIFLKGNMEGINQVQDATMCPMPWFIPEPPGLPENGIRKTAEWGESQRSVDVAGGVEWGVGWEKNKSDLVVKNHTGILRQSPESC